MPSSGVQTCARSEEHTSELQSHDNLVCRLLLEKKNENFTAPPTPEPPLPVSTRYHHPGAGVARVREISEGGGGWTFRDSSAVVAFFFLKDGGPPNISAFPLPPLFRF